MVFLLTVLAINVTAVLIWLKVLSSLQEYRREKGQVHILKTFFFTGLLSIPAAMQLYSIWYAVFGKLFVPYAYTVNVFLNNFLITGPVEELAKFGIFFATAKLFHSVKEPRDAILQAGSVALGFAVVENFFYAGWTGSLLVLIERSLFAVLGHISYAGIWGYAAGAFLYTRKLEKNSYGFSVVLFSLIISAAFHGLFNFLIDIGRSEWSLLVDVLTVFLSLKALRYLKEKSPYKTYPLAAWKKAVPVLEDALKTSPQSFLLNKRIAVYYLYGARVKKAAEHFRRALRARREDNSLRLFLAVTDYLSGNEEEANKRLNRLGPTLSSGEINRFIRTLDKVILRYSMKNEIIALLQELRDHGHLSLHRPRSHTLSRISAASRPIRSSGRGTDASEKPELIARKGRALARIMREKFERGGSN